MSEAESDSSPRGTIKWRLHAARKRLSKLLRLEQTTAKTAELRAALAEGGNDRD